MELSLVRSRRMDTLKKDVIKVRFSGSLVSAAIGIGHSANCQAALLVPAATARSPYKQSLAETFRLLFAF